VQLKARQDVRSRDVLSLFQRSVEDAADVLFELEDWGFLAPSSPDGEGDGDA
jgi:hypothetical protein